MICKFVVPGPPQPKQRPRVTRWGTHTPDETRVYENRVAIFARQAGCRPLAGPVRVDILAVLARPARLLRKRDPDGLIWAPVRPDADNIRKAVLDALPGIAYADDGQVVAGETLKVYAERGGHPRCEVTISSLDDVAVTT